VSLWVDGILVLAQATEQVAKAEQNFILQYLSDGGWMMYVILLFSLFGTLLFLERAFNLYLVRGLNSKSFMAKVIDHVNHRRIREALDLCEVRSKHPLVSVMKAGLVRTNRREKEIERAMEDQMLASLDGVTKRVELMSLLANIATLLGLLGTIFGLISAFSSVAAASAAERQAALAAGISQAMYTTAFGISVAVPLLIFHHILSKRSEKILIDTEGGATSLLVALGGQASEMERPDLKEVA
jgi:biopolymer transport protein ExbB